MRRYLVPIELTAIVGAIIGLMIGLSAQSSIWPRLSLIQIVWSMTVGWVVGLGLSAALAWAIGRRVTFSAGREPRLRRGVGRAVLALVALAPGVLWVVLPPLSGFSWTAVATGRRPLDTRPNIVLIGIDALRADHIGAYGSQQGLTPMLDEFAREATVYESAYAPAPWTLPSFGTIFTSRVPSVAGLIKAPGEDAASYAIRAMLPNRNPMLSEQLHAAGYATAAVLTNPFLAEERGWNRGFDGFFNADGPGIDSLISSDHTRAQGVTEHARAWLQLNREEPFFLWVHYLDPHGPYESSDTPQQLRAKYPPDWTGSRLYYYEEIEGAAPEVRIRYAEFCREMYAEEVRYADRWVGELLAELKKSAAYRNSVVVIIADHGEELFDHGGIDHGHSVHEEVLRVPLLVKWPAGVQADGRVSQTVGLADLTGTLAQLAGAPSIDGLGRRVLPRRDRGVGGEVYSEGLMHGSEQTALTTDDYRITYHPSGGEFEVYDRRTDRAEQFDLSHTGEAAEVRERLKLLTDEALRNARETTPSEEGMPQPTELPAETRRRLRTLGYLSD